MKLLITATIIVAICIAAMAISIIVRKDGKFPDGEISHNKELRRQGITCARTEEMRRWRKGSCPDGGCEGCDFYRKG